jgi:hypothetical protein
MNKYAVVLSSIVDGATVSIQILVESEMSASQLATYYKCKSITISDVYVEALTLPELAQENYQTPVDAL